MQATIPNIASAIRVLINADRPFLAVEQFVPHRPSLLIGRSCATTRSTWLLREEDRLLASWSNAACFCRSPLSRCRPPPSDRHFVLPASLWFASPRAVRWLCHLFSRRETQNRSGARARSDQTGVSRSRRRGRRGRAPGVPLQKPSPEP